VAEEALLDAMQMAEQLERDGANNYRLFEPVTAAREDLDSDEQLAASVKRALQSNQLRLVFQPLLAAEAEGGHYYQAWVRLISRSGKLVPARAFLDVARKYELLGPLQRWCLRQSLRYLATGHGAPSALRLFVNASPEAFSPRMLDYLDRIFRRHPEIPPRLIAEFDRFDLANRQRETQRVMARLREYGVRLGVSGVGEEHFSDTVLDDAPVEFIRLAPGMDQRLRDQPQLAGELMGFLSRAHHQQRSVIMPDVDREDQIIQFWQAGVDFIQGEFIERPRTRAPES